MKSKLSSFLLLFLVAVSTSFGLTHNVINTNTNGAGSLRYLVSIASPGDTILFSTSIDTSPINLTSAQILIDKDLVIIGNGTEKTIIDGQASNRIFEVLVNKTVLIENLTIQNGKVNNFTTTKPFLGGGIYTEGYLKLMNVKVLNNHIETLNATSLGKGGGIYSKNGSLELIKTTIAGNSITVTNTNIFNPNAATVEAYGGGIYVNNDLIAKNSIISGNFTKTISAAYNSFSLGAGIYFEQGSHQLNNTTIAGNSMEAISTNIAPLTTLGGGFYANDAVLVFNNSIVALNSNDYYLAGSSTITGSNNHIFSYPDGTSLSSGFNIDPLFRINVPSAPSIGGDLRLQGCSNDINSGTVDTTGLYLGQIDLEEKPRVFDDRIDKGAHEFQFVASTNTLLVTNNIDKSCGSLRYVVANAAANDTIRFSQSINTDSIKLTSGQILIDKHLVIIGNGVTQTIIDGHSNDRIFKILATGSLVLDSLRLQNGDVRTKSFGNERGGAIYTQGDLTVKNSSFIENKAVVAGAIGAPNVSDIDIFIKNSTFSNNQCTNSAAVISFVGDTLSISNTTFNNNQCTDLPGIGGTIYFFTNTNSTALIDNSTFSANSAFGTAGAIYMFGGNMEISNSTFFENSAQYGGGLIVEGTDLEIQNSIFKNTATLNGNDIDKVSGTITSLGNNLVYSAIGGHGITDGNGIDPLLLPLANNGGPTQTHAIPCTSPAYNAGVGTSMDQRGKAVFGSAKDIGAFEYQGSVAGLSLSVLNPISTGPETIYAEIIEGESIISSPSLISFDAVRYINLKPGFQASTNTVFEAKIVSGCE